MKALIEPADILINWYSYFARSDSQPVWQPSLWAQSTKSWAQSTGFWAQSTGFWAQSTGFWAQSTKCRTAAPLGRDTAVYSLS